MLNNKNKIQNIMGGFNVQGLFGGGVGSELGYQYIDVNLIFNVNKSVSYIMKNFVDCIYLLCFRIWI